MIIFEDSELLIRSYESSDLSQLPDLLTNPITMEFWPAAFTQDQVYSWQARMIEAYRGTRQGRWAVIEQASQKLIADAGIPRSVVNGQEENDLGYIVDHKYWQKGLGTRIAAACLDYGFKKAGLSRIIAHMAENHIGSQKVAQKIGMQWESDFINSQNRGFRHHLYAISREAYLDRL